jgi:hypothetical protein
VEPAATAGRRKPNETEKPLRHPWGRRKGLVREPEGSVIGAESAELARLVCEAEFAQERGTLVLGDTDGCGAREAEGLACGMR